MSGAGGRPDVRPMLADLWEDARERALARVAVLEDAIAAVMAGALDDELRAAARQEAHRLVGALGTFGVAGATATARTLEAAFDGQPLLAAAPALAGDVLLLRRAIDAHDPAAEREPEIPAAPPLALIGVGDELTSRLDAGATDRGWRLATPDEPVALAVVGVRTADDLEALDRLATQEPGPAIAALLLDPVDGGGPPVDPVEVVRRGAHRLLPASAQPAAILDELEALERSRREAGGTILALEDDPDALAALESALRMDAHTLVTGVDAADLPAMLTVHEPDLLVLDVDLPGADGIAVCRAVRADPRHGALPILFLTARTEPDTITALFAAGADDYVAKPVVGPELAVRIRNRLERVRLQRRLREVDPLTGLLRREPATDQLERLAASAERLRQPLWVAVLGIDGLQARNEAFGHAAGDRALQALAEAIKGAAGPADVAGRWAGGTLVLGMLGTGAHDVRSRVGDIVETVRRRDLEGSGTASAGLAEYPTNGATVAELVAAATATRRAAVEAGGDRVLHPWMPTRATDRVEVVIVEDDEVLARLLTHALETRGYRTRTIPDGNEAAALLGGARPQIRTDLVVLDWDLPGRDGLTVLRQLAADGVLPSTRVLMLTARASEREVLAALELGADDHVAKPFSVAVLLQRVRRILGR